MALVCTEFGRLITRAWVVSLHFYNSDPCVVQQKQHCRTSITSKASQSSGGSLFYCGLHGEFKRCACLTVGSTWPIPEETYYGGLLATLKARRQALKRLFWISVSQGAEIRYPLGTCLKSIAFRLQNRPTLLPTSIRTPALLDSCCKASIRATLLFPANSHHGCTRFMPTRRHNHSHSLNRNETKAHINRVPKLSMSKRGCGWFGCCGGPHCRSFATGVHSAPKRDVQVSNNKPRAAKATCCVAF